ncbi:substrate-binding periplasmic protein [Roseateles microcysteis]|uniref:substrate-binding periplasmic protein n=1 Tax=Roseateles microcysteis TaxID=3119057 RepID=UPI002FE5624F
MAVTGLGQRLFAILSFLPLACPALAAEGPARITFLLPETPAVFVRDPATGVFSGRGIDMLRRLAKHANIGEPLFEQTITARALLDANTRAGTCAVGMGRSPEREAQFLWAGPISRAELVLLARADDTRRFASLEDARNLTIGAIRNSVVAQRLRAQNLQVEEVADDATNLRKLQAQRIDVWAANGFVAREELRNAIAPPPKVVLSFGLIETFIACNPQMDEALFAAIRQAVATLTREGAFSTVKP